MLTKILTKRHLQLIGIGVFLLSPIAHASDSDLGKYANCYMAAAQYHQVNPIVLRAIAIVESDENPRAFRRNKNGSVDVGIMQVNSIHLQTLAKYGIDNQALWTPCYNIYIGAWLLRHEMNIAGNTWEAIGRYKSRTPSIRREYSLLISKAVHRLGY